MGGRLSSFRAKKSGGGLNKKENAEKATNGAGLDNMTYYNAHTATYDRWKARKDREFEERFVSSYGYNPIKTILKRGNNMGGRSSSFGKHAGGGATMADLQGSEKQVKWAGEIRDEFKDQFNYFEKHYLDKKYDAGEDYKAKTGEFPSRRRGGFPQFLRKPEIKAKVEESRKIGTKQDTSKEYTKTLAYKGYKANEYTGIKERTDFKTEKEYHDYLVKGARKAFSEKSASWWIDHRKK